VSDRGGLLVRTRTTVIDWPTAKPAEAATGMTVAFTVVLLVPRFKARKTFHVGLPEGQVRHGNWDQALRPAGRQTLAPKG
jgi:hypothetical protein